MNSFLLFLLKSALSLSLLYLAFRVLMCRETFFKLNRMVLLGMVLCSVLIPFLYTPQLFQPFIQVNLKPIFQNEIILEEAVRPALSQTAAIMNEPVTKPVGPVTLSFPTVFMIVYLLGVWVSFLLFTYSIGSVVLLFRKARQIETNGFRLMVVRSDIPAFSFGRNILISQHDYEVNSEAIISHEQSHIRMGHFYDLMLMELAKIFFWFNPLIYSIVRDLKEIHEFQADDDTLHSGIDATQYQLLIIQKCVGHQKFALANSFNHCQIKNRIVMMNKSKTSKAWRWKVAIFLPLLALLLMAFGRKGENVPEKRNLPESVIAKSGLVGNQYGQFKRKIDIRKDGNYIDNKQCSLQDIARTGKEWTTAGNDWIFLLIDEAVPLSRVDEVRDALGHDYWVVQSTVNSDDLVYFSGDVSESAKFTQGKWGEWMAHQQINSPEIKSKVGQYKIAYSFIIDRNGKVRDGHLIKRCDFPEVNAAFEKILTQIPDWEPAKRGSEKISVYYRFSSSAKYVAPVVKK